MAIASLPHQCMPRPLGTAAITLQIDVENQPPCETRDSRCRQQARGRTFPNAFKQAVAKQSHRAQSLGKSPCPVNAELFANVVCAAEYPCPCLDLKV